MEGSVVDLSKYRLETAREDLETARITMISLWFQLKKHKIKSIKRKRCFR